MFKLKRINGIFQYCVQFTESCKYDHGDNDQYDWNKLFGIKTNYFRPRYNNIMGCWRWVNDEIQYGTYVHYNGATVMPEGDDIKRAKIGEWVCFSISGNGWLSLPWFGGQKRAPHTMTINAMI